MRSIFVIFLIFIISTGVFAHEIQSITQHVSITKQNETGWQQDLIGTIDVNKKFDVGAQATYLERFDFYEKRYGGFVTFRPDDRWTLEARYLQGPGNQILPEKQGILSAYYALAPGWAPFVYYRDTRYSVTHVNTANLGVEIEKFPHLIIIPSFMVGNATFKSPANTDSVYNYGLRVIWYEQQKYGAAVFAYKGREASQGIIGVSTILVDTTSAGASLYYFFKDNFKTELVFDHTDYDQLNTQFLTTILNLTWTL